MKAHYYVCHVPPTTVFNYQTLPSYCANLTVGLVRAMTFIVVTVSVGKPLVTGIAGKGFSIIKYAIMMG
jgi:hypothetical protein